MRKLKLHPDSLRIESFGTTSDPQTNGTVLGHDASWTQPVYNTCQFNCGTTVRYTVCNTNPCM
jgi:hypothetical protein